MSTTPASEASSGVTVERNGDAVVVTLCWPDRRNAMGPADGDTLAAAIRDADIAGAGALVLTGQGAFCAGGDLKSFAEVSAASDDEQMLSVVYGKMQAVVRALYEVPVPTIAAVDGAAIGLGFDYALACDIRMVGPDGWFRQGWAGAGLIHGMGGIGLLQRLHPTIMWDLIATQRRVDAEAAERLGLGERADPTALDLAIERAGSYSSIPADVLGYYVELSRSHNWPDAAHFDRSAEIQAKLIGSQRFRDLAADVLANR